MCSSGLFNDLYVTSFTGIMTLRTVFSLQDNDEEATGGGMEETSQALPRTNKRAVIEESSDEDE